ncbi:MAG: hypothetical protein K6U02_11500 [Firmicutes bacterium]|nr:hypothetical protein [Bacillota bacterium]
MAGADPEQLGGCGGRTSAGGGNIGSPANIEIGFQRHKEQQAQRALEALTAAFLCGGQQGAATDVGGGAFSHLCAEFGRPAIPPVWPAFTKGTASWTWLARPSAQAKGCTATEFWRSRK